MRAIALCLTLALCSCGLLRWTFSPQSDGASPAEKAAHVIAENGTDPGKWITWLAGLGAVVTAGGGYAAGRVHGRDRRSGRDRRLADTPGSDDPRAAGNV